MRIAQRAPPLSAVLSVLPGGCVQLDEALCRILKGDADRQPQPVPRRGPYAAALSGRCRRRRVGDLAGPLARLLQGKEPERTEAEVAIFAGDGRPVDAQGPTEGAVLLRPDEVEAATVVVPAELLLANNLPDPRGAKKVARTMLLPMV